MLCDVRKSVSSFRENSYFDNTADGQSQRVANEFIDSQKGYTRTWITLTPVTLVKTCTAIDLGDSSVAADRNRL